MGTRGGKGEGDAAAARKVIHNPQAMEIIAQPCRRVMTRAARDGSEPRRTTTPSGRQRSDEAPRPGRPATDSRRLLKEFTYHGQMLGQGSVTSMQQAHARRAKNTAATIKGVQHLFQRDGCLRSIHGWAIANLNRISNNLHEIPPACLNKRAIDPVGSTWVTRGRAGFGAEAGKSAGGAQQEKQKQRQLVQKAIPATVKE